LKQALTVASTPQAGLSQRLQTQLEAFKTTETVGGKEAKVFIYTDFIFCVWSQKL